MAASSPRILIVEDEDVLARGISEALTFQGFDCTVKGDGTSGLEAALRGHFDVMVLDIMLPEKSGFDVIAEMRAAGCPTPTIMLTAKGSEEDKVRGLELGADDYMTKPFAVRELVARVGAQFRRTLMDRGSGEKFSANGVAFDLGRLTVTRNGDEIPLTPREGDIVSYLRSKRGNIVTRDDFLLHVWKYPTANVQTRTVDNTLAALRKKVEENPARPDLILTVRGKGYRWGG